jgi:hypothetical protein
VKWLQTKFRSNLILGLATRGPKTQKVLDHCWIISKFLSLVHLVRMHDIIPGFLIWPTFQGPSSYGSIRRMHFVTAGAIDLKLCTYVPLGHLTSQTKFRSYLNLGLATRGQNRKQRKCYNSWTNDWIYSIFLSLVHLIRIHEIIPGFLIWPTFQGHRGQSSSGSVSRARFVPTLAIDLKLTMQSAVLCLQSYLHVNSTTVNKSVKIHSPTQTVIKHHMSKWSMDHFIMFVI